MSKSENRWIITSLNFKQHATYESMETELRRLSALCPDKEFRAIRIKQTTADVGADVEYAVSSPRDFCNRLRILTSIDQDELVNAGIESMRDPNAWRSFMGDPSRWLIRASDEDAAKLWSIVVARSTRAPTVTVVAPSPIEGAC